MNSRETIFDRSSKLICFADAMDIVGNTFEACTAVWYVSQQKFN